MKYNLSNSTEEQTNFSAGIHYVEIPEISEEDLPKGIVDLGLSVKWSSCNIGASNPCESGLLFQFGRVDGYVYGDTNNKFYLGESVPPTTSGKTYTEGEVLDKKDDAAYFATNGKLRMPTVDEIDMSTEKKLGY